VLFCTFVRISGPTSRNKTIDANSAAACGGVRQAAPLPQHFKSARGGAGARADVPPSTYLPRRCLLYGYSSGIAEIYPGGRSLCVARQRYIPYIEPAGGPGDRARPSLLSPRNRRYLHQFPDHQQMCHDSAHPPPPEAVAANPMSDVLPRADFLTMEQRKRFFFREFTGIWERRTTVRSRREYPFGNFLRTRRKAAISSADTMGPERSCSASRGPRRAFLGCSDIEGDILGAMPKRAEEKRLRQPRVARQRGGGRGRGARTSPSKRGRPVNARNGGIPNRNTGPTIG